MCHQTVSLVGRHLEANGIPTVVIGSARDIVEQCGVARFLFTDFPLGNACGRPWDVDMQRAIVSMAFDLLAFLMTHPGRVFTRLELLEAVRGETYGSFERAIDSHVKRIRQRIEPDPHNPTYLVTVFGIGYKLAKGTEG